MESLIFHVLECNTRANTPLPQGGNVPVLSKMGLSPPFSQLLCFYWCSLRSCFMPRLLVHIGLFDDWNLSPFSYGLLRRSVSWKLVDNGLFGHKHRVCSYLSLLSVCGTSLFIDGIWLLSYKCCKKKKMLFPPHCLWDVGDNDGLKASPGDPHSDTDPLLLWIERNPCCLGQSWSSELYILLLCFWGPYSWTNLGPIRGFLKRRHFCQA